MILPSIKGDVEEAVAAGAASGLLVAAQGIIMGSGRIPMTLGLETAATATPLICRVVH